MDRAPGAVLPRQGRRALDHAVFAVAVAPADLDRLRSVVVTQVAELVPQAVASLEPTDSERGQELLRAAVTDPRPDHLVLPLRCDGLVVGVLAVRTLRPLTSVQDAAVRRFGEVVGRRLADAVHGTPQERATVEALRTREHQLLAAQRMASITVWHWKVSDNTIEWLDADGRDLGLDGLGKTQEDYLAGIHPDDVEEHNRKLLALLAAPGHAEVELRYRWEDGWRNWHLWAESVADERGIVQSLWGTTQDVTVQRSNEAAMRRLAVTDSLTGLANRPSLQDELDQALQAGACAVLLLDLDRFKAVNDELGHETGDAVIVACADALRERTRGYDELVRLGGDEFVVVAPVPDVLDARRLAEEIRVHIADRCNALLPADWGLTAAIGVAVFPDAAVDPESLLRAADIALYRAKDSGVEGVVVSEPAVADITTRGPRVRRGLSRRD